MSCLVGNRLLGNMASSYFFGRRARCFFMDSVVQCLAGSVMPFFKGNCMLALRETTCLLWHIGFCAVRVLIAVRGHFHAAIDRHCKGRFGCFPCAGFRKHFILLY